MTWAPRQRRSATAWIRSRRRATCACGAACRSGCHIKGDASLVEKAVANVVENAITYSEPGALVLVGLADGVLKVENSGAHIDEADLPRLFEPFFRVDRSRSRESGGPAWAST